MSADFTKILVKDDRLEVVDNIKYAVVKGGQNVTMSQFNAISATNNQLVFNIQVPSEQTIIDRRVLLQTELTLRVESSTITASGAPGAQAYAFVAPKTGCGYGVCAGLAPYPLHQLMTVASATINNNTVSINIRDVLPFIIRALDKGEVNAYNSTTTTATDSLLKYTSGLSLASNPLSGGIPTLDTNMVGRGSISLVDYIIDTSDATKSVETLKFHISEPLMISPFIYCNPKSNAQGFYGIQNMNFVLNIGGTERVFRGLDGVNGMDISGALPVVNTSKVYASPAGNFNPAPTGATQTLPFIRNVFMGGVSDVSGFSNTRLLFAFLTPHPSDLMPARNIVPYYELPRYITAATTKSVITPKPAGSKNFFLPASYTGGNLIPSQTLQLNQIPDKLVLFVRKPAASLKYGDTDSFLPIRKVSIDFNNNSGILASAQTEDLYRMSKDNGNNQSWSEFSGLVSAQYYDFYFGNGGGTVAVIDPTPFSGAASTGSAPAGGRDSHDLFIDAVNGAPTSSFGSFPTCGSCLMLEFGKDIQLIEDFFAPGSLGNFNIRVQVYVENYNDSIAATSGDDVGIELVMITMNSGVFVCERGTSSTYTGILTRADVLEASEQDAYSHSDVKRMVGGGFLDMLKSGVSKLAPLVKAVAPMVAPMAKEYLGKKGAMGKLAAQGIGALGYGHSGAGMSGGALKGRYM